MHEKINTARQDIISLTEDCLPVWTPQMELDDLENKRTRIKFVKERINREPLCIDLFDANLRDMTGMRYADSHVLTHEAKNLTNEQTPCWTCQKAATRQLRKYSDESE